MRRRWIECGLLFVVLAWPLVSWGQDAVVVYSSVDEENAKKLLDAFTKATNIKVRFTFLASGPAVARIEAETSPAGRLSACRPGRRRCRRWRRM